MQVSAGDFRIVGTENFLKMGMFASLNQVLGHLYEYENGDSVSGVLIDFDVYGLYYDVRYGPNWWSYYFEPICVGEQAGSEVRHPTKKEYYEAFQTRRKITKTQSAEIVNKYIRAKQHIQDKVDQFERENFRGDFVLGVHYRGTDKWTEAVRLPYESVIEKIRECIPQTEYRIFVATDETAFLETMQEAFPTRVVATVAHRATGKKGVHFSKEDHYEIGEEALIDSLLLARCNLLIRTSSSLSLWSTYFNPEMPVILLNSNYRNTKSIEPE
jgi:hypothetical protein